MNENNLVKRISFLSTGDGFRRCVPKGILAEVKDATGQILTGATVPAIAVFEINFYGIKVVAGQTHAGLLKWAVPDDYDNTADELRIRILCNRSGSVDPGIKITPFIYRKRFNPGLTFTLNGTTYTGDGTGVALSADLGAPASDALPILASAATDLLPSTANANTRWVEINADYNLPHPTAAQIAAGTKNRSLAATADATIRAGDALSIKLTTGTLTTDDLNIYAMEIWYRSNLAFTNIDNR
jgi:hypothetical protein